MYQYKYVHLDTDDDFFTGPLKHRELIDQHAAEGWRYVGFFPRPSTSAAGSASWI